MTEHQDDFIIETAAEALAFIQEHAEKMFKSEMLTDILINMAKTLEREDPTQVVHAAVLVLVLADEESGELRVFRGMDCVSRGASAALADTLDQTAEVAAQAAETEEINA